MRSGTLTYTLTKRNLHRVLGRRLKEHQEEQTRFGRAPRSPHDRIHPGWLEEVRCWQCGNKINLGEELVSKRKGKYFRVQYDKQCAEMLNII